MNDSHYSVHTFVNMHLYINTGDVFAKTTISNIDPRYVVAMGLTVSDHFGIIIITSASLCDRI